MVKGDPGVYNFMRLPSLNFGGSNFPSKSKSVPSSINSGT